MEGGDGSGFGGARDGMLNDSQSLRFVHSVQSIHSVHWPARWLQSAGREDLGRCVAKSGGFAVIVVAAKLDQA